MISICIPVFNFDIKNLIGELSKQGNELNIEYEIIVIDDCSQKFKGENKNSCKNISYIELPQNVGRASIRNMFLNHVKFDYLLFLDCDSIISKSNFLKNYILEISQNSELVCGGRIYSDSKPNKNFLLSWKYGKYKESQPVENRKINPFKSFMTNNFLIKKSILENIKFDERIKLYGHEDTLFGIELLKKKTLIKHIENPITNGDIENNKIFLNKTEQSVLNLIEILKFTEYKNELLENITLLKTFFKLKKFQKIINILFVILKPMMNFCFSNGLISLYLFDFYKLGFLSKNIFEPEEKKSFYKTKI